MVVLALGDLSVRTLTDQRTPGDPRRPYETLAIRNEGIELLMVTGSPMAAVSRRTARLHGESAELIHRFGFDVELNTLKVCVGSAPGSVGELLMCGSQDSKLLKDLHGSRIHVDLRPMHVTLSSRKYRSLMGFINSVTATIATTFGGGGASPVPATATTAGGAAPVVAPPGALLLAPAAGAAGDAAGGAAPSAAPAAAGASAGAAVGAPPSAAVVSGTSEPPLGMLLRVQLSELSVTIALSAADVRGGAVVGARDELPICLAGIFRDSSRHGAASRVVTYAHVFGEGAQPVLHLSLQDINFSMHGRGAVSRLAVSIAGLRGDDLLRRLYLDSAADVVRGRREPAWPPPHPSEFCTLLSVSRVGSTGVPDELDGDFTGDAAGWDAPPSASAEAGSTGSAVLSIAIDMGNSALPSDFVIDASLPTLAIVANRDTIGALLIFIFAPSSVPADPAAPPVSPAPSVVLPGPKHNLTGFMSPLSVLDVNERPSMLVRCAERTVFLVFDGLCELCR